MEVPGRASLRSVAVAVVNASADAFLVSEASCKLPTLLVTEQDCLLKAGERLLWSQFGLRADVHVVPLAVMADEEAVPDSAGTPVHFVLFVCCSEIGECDPLLMLDPKEMATPERHARWHALSEAGRLLADTMSIDADGLATRWESLVRESLAAAEATDLSGTWSRDASSNAGVEEALLARGLSAERARAEASRPYVQHWQRDADEPTSWVVTTLDAAVDMNQEAHMGAHRRLVYPLGDWVESYLGVSTLHGAATRHTPMGTGTSDGTLVRRTAWMPRRSGLLEPSLAATRSHAPTSFGEDGSRSPEYTSSPEAAPTGALPPPPALCAAHTTWTSRTDATGEIVSRFLYKGRMIVRRTQVATPSVANALAGRVPVVCQEVFVKIDHAMS